MTLPDFNDPRFSKLLARVASGQPIDFNSDEIRALDRTLIELLRMLVDLPHDEGKGLVASWADEETRPPEAPPGPNPSEWRHLSDLEEVGRGQLGTVFRAWDSVLEKEVALKLLHSVAAGTEERVVTEARLLARVANSNVVTVLGADRADGRVGVWMEFISGHTLSTCQERNGPYSAHEALLYGLDICRALAGVHHAGLVHGDVKAQNVMRARGGRIVLTDFGAARLARVAASSSEPVQATPAYAAPEVLNGSPPTFQSDIYSLGVLLFYLVSGKYPFNAASIDELKRVHAENRRLLLRDIRPDLPSSFLLVVDSATASRPEDRPPTAGALEVIIANASGPGPALRPLPSSAQTPAPAADPDASVMVMTFTDMTAEKRLGYFCEGLAEEIFDALTRTPGLRAVAPRAGLHPDAPPEAVLQMAKALGVSAVLQGSVRANGHTLRVIARLLDATTGSFQWSEKFERKLDDVFGVQDDITEATVAQLGVRMQKHRPHERGTTLAARDADAYMLYLKGRHCWNQRTEPALRKSVELFRAAIDRDPNYGEAYAGLAEAYATLGLYGVVAPDSVMSKAKQAAQHAVSIAGHLPAPHATSGCIAAVYDWSWHEAARHFHRALEINEQHPVAHHWYAINYLVPLRRFDEALFELRRAADADPLSAPIRASFGIRSYFAHSFEDAEQELRETLSAEPGAATARLFLGLTLVERGAFAGAIQELETAMYVAASPEMRAGLAYALVRAGHTDAARSHLGALMEVSRERYVSPSLIAQIHAGLGHVSQAVTWLERAVDVRAADLAWIGVRPVFDALRSDSAFNNLVTRVQP